MKGSFININSRSCLSNGRNPEDTDHSNSDNEEELRGKGFENLINLDSSTDGSQKLYDQIEDIVFGSFDKPHFSTETKVIEENMPKFCENFMNF